jgi:hypothetical protein
MNKTPFLNGIFSLELIFSKYVKESISSKEVSGVCSKHGQTLTNKTKPGPSFQLYMWACVHVDKHKHIIRTA